MSCPPPKVDWAPTPMFTAFVEDSSYIKPAVLCTNYLLQMLYSSFWLRRVLVLQLHIYLSWNIFCPVNKYVLSSLRSFLYYSSPGACLRRRSRCHEFPPSRSGASQLVTRPTRHTWRVDRCDDLTLWRVDCDELTVVTRWLWWVEREELGCVPCRW